jgi:hypothetical protein
MVGLEVTIAGEAVMVVPVFSEVVEQVGTSREVSTIGVMITADLEMADIVAAGVGNVLILGDIAHELAVTALAVVVGIAMDEVIEDSAVVYEPAFAGAAVFLTRAVCVAIFRHQIDAMEVGNKGK